MHASVSTVIKEAVAERCSVKKGVHKNFTKFTGKQFVGVSFLIKLQTKLSTFDPYCLNVTEKKLIL